MSCGDTGRVRATLDGDAVGLTARHAAEGITCNAVMPGGIRTGLQRHMSQEDLAANGWDVAQPQGWKTPQQGAATSVWAAVAPELEGVGGEYLDNCAVAAPWTRDGNPPDGHYLPYALDPDHAERLWTLSDDLVQGRREP